jgi:catechol 2,3-dioxygenase-like lactoylglutathione lyase family enzyme
VATVNVRNIVDDVGTSIDFYTTHFGFEVESNSAPAFAALRLGELRLLLSGETSSAGRPMPDGRRPEPGGWARIQLLVTDLPAEVDRLRAAGLVFSERHRQGPGRFPDPH